MESPDTILRSPMGWFCPGKATQNQVGNHFGNEEIVDIQLYTNDFLPQTHNTIFSTLFYFTLLLTPFYTLAALPEPWWKKRESKQYSLDRNTFWRRWVGPWKLYFITGVTCRVSWHTHRLQCSNLAHLFPSSKHKNVVASSGSWVAEDVLAQIETRTNSD